MNILYKMQQDSAIYQKKFLVNNVLYLAKKNKNNYTLHIHVDKLLGGGYTICDITLSYNVGRKL